jgi:hypothetical protein
VYRIEPSVMNVFERIGIGLKALFWAWFVVGGAEHLAPAVRSLGEAGEREKRGGGGAGVKEPPAVAPPAPKVAAPPPKPVAPARAARSEALTLLEALQREARLIDFLKEDIAPYQDAQIGAAVRDIHRDGGKVLERLFALRPVLDQAEGSAVTLGGDQAGRIRLVGKVREGVASGSLVHHGWEATKVELPVWSGPVAAERVVAPAEVELS